MEVLIVEDEDSVRDQLAILLENMGHRVIQAADGHSAIAAFEEHKPELILMDVVMPDMGGEEATRKIKALAGNSFVPVIFVTSLNDINKLADLVEAGGDDFLIKPLDPVVLTAKMNAFTRISEMYKKLDAYQRTTEDELETSKHLLNTLLNIDACEVGAVDVWAASPGHFSGDLRLVRKREDGEVMILLCDFTGHGLPAAIGTIFVADLFRSMTRKSFEASVILDEVNEKMYQILPTGRYCAAIMISYKPDEQTLKIWNCGLPTLYLLDDEHQIITRVESGHVPLGVLGGQVKSEPITFDTNQYRSVVLFSDGITEAENPNREMYTEERLIEKIQHTAPAGSVFDVVKNDVEKFIDDAPLSDDISFIVLRLR
ncbi:MAG: fused response regulator/phosphatase, partial [Gammaproteobacteria bacterium]|nr:fused response regulator/phosphatase [Gammaproteobacteria bacterium]